MAPFPFCERNTASLQMRSWKKCCHCCEKNPASGQPQPRAAKSEGRLRFRKRPSYFDGDKPNSVGVIAHADDHLSHPAPVLLATRQDRHLHSRNWGRTSDSCFGGHRPPLQAVVMRRYPRINGPAALPLFCLAPHGVFRASRIAPRAVSSYLAFSPLPVPAREADSFPYSCP